MATGFLGETLIKKLIVYEMVFDKRNDFISFQSKKICYNVINL